MNNKNFYSMKTTNVKIKIKKPFALFPGGGQNPLNRRILKALLILTAFLSCFSVQFSQDVTLISDINPTGSSNPLLFTVYNNHLFFRADDSIHGIELWKYDGVNQPVMIDVDLSGPSGPTDGIVFNNRLFFNPGKCFYDSDEGDYYCNNYEIWQIDDNSDPEVIDGTEGKYCFEFTPFKGLLLFFTSGDTGNYLWKYDGINVPELVTGIKIRVLKGIETNNNFYFLSTDNRLFKYDGVHDPKMQIDLSLFGNVYSKFVFFKNSIYYIGSEPGYNHQVFKYDFINNPSVAFHVNENYDAYPSNLTVFGDKLIFTADDGIHGSELWEFNGTDAPQMVMDFDTVPNHDSYPSEFYLF